MFNGAESLRLLQTISLHEFIAREMSGATVDFLQGLHDLLADAFLVEARIAHAEINGERRVWVRQSGVRGHHMPRDGCGRRRDTDCIAEDEEAPLLDAELGQGNLLRIVRVLVGVDLIECFDTGRKSGC
jgi:hypothetical protein